MNMAGLRAWVTCGEGEGGREGDGDGDARQGGTICHKERSPNLLSFREASISLNFAFLSRMLM